MFSSRERGSVATACSSGFSTVGAWLLVLACLGCTENATAEKAATADPRWESQAPTLVDDVPSLSAAEMKAALGASDSAQLSRAGRHFIGAMLVNSGVKTLEPLKGQPLKAIDLEGNPVADISPLTGAPIERMSLSNTQVADLSPLADMPLQVLDLTKSKVTDLSPLAGVKTLTQLFAEETGVADLSPLKDLPLATLYLIKSPVADLSPLAGKEMQELNLCETAVTDLSGLQGTKLGILWLRKTKVVDLSPLKGSSLVSLDVQDSQVADLSPLAEIKTLERLNIAGAPVTDLTPLAGLTLQRLIFTPGSITAGIDVVRNMTSLRQIDTSFEGVETPLTPEEFWPKYDQGEFAKPSEPAS